MSALAKGLYDGLRGESTITADLPAYEGGFSIFNTSPIPPDAPWPMIVFTVAQGWENFDTKTTTGHEIFIDIGVFDEASGSTVIIDRLAEAVRDFLHRNLTALTIAGFNLRIISATGPISNDVEKVYGRMVSLRLVIEEI